MENLIKIKNIKFKQKEWHLAFKEKECENFDKSWKF